MRQSNGISRRGFLAGAPVAGAALAAPRLHNSTEKPAALGGKPVRTAPFPSWPVYGPEEEQALVEVVRSGHWYRGSGQMARRFEEAYARLTGARHCVATSSGTGALISSLGALGVGPGDEVILPPFTFVATLNVVLMMHALPVFVDSELDTGQIDAKKIDAAITGRTAAIMPVHLGGASSDLDAILATARKRNVPVVEDACQSHLAEWRGRKVGTYGATGCFSFQASKNLNCGEGGAILANDDETYEKCFAFHWNGSGRKTANFDFRDSLHGAKFLITEFQAAILLAQMARLEAQAGKREDNGRYLTSMLREIPGVGAWRTHDGCTRHAYHLYMLRYQKEQFANMPRAKFLKALAAEGVPGSAGYTPLNKRKYLKNALRSRGYQRLFSASELAAWEERNQCPVNDRLCEEAVWFSQQMLLGTRSDMEQIAEAIAKIQSHAGELARA